MGVCVCACEAIWTEWQGLGQILGCPTHSWLMIQSWSTALCTSRHGTPWMRTCICACELFCLCVQACESDWCVYRCLCAQAYCCTNKCVYLRYVLIRRKAELSEIKRRPFLLYVPCFWRQAVIILGHKRRTEWKRGVSKLQRENQRDAFQGCSYNAFQPCYCESHTPGRTQLHKPIHYIYKDSNSALTWTTREGKQRHDYE